MNKKGHKIKKKRLRIKAILKVLLFLVMISAFFLYKNNLDTKNIIINGNTKIKDVEIIETAGVQDYPKIFKLNIKKIEDNLKKIPLIKKVEIKRNILGKLTITIEEKEILFYYKYNQKYIANDKTEIEPSDKIMGYPTLVNFTPDTSFKELINGLNKIDKNIIKMINEIEYTPYKSSNGQTIEESGIYTNARFTLYMNDLNKVIIDTVNIKRLNNYTKIYTSLKMDEKKGILELDTINDKSEEDGETILFRSYQAIAESEANKKAKEEQNQGE